ncbi:MAG TPA: NAD(+) synthase, partial [Desulfobacterales bacterium]|nr:NAD(+) synthase [Desulfobacterales bacterium]
LMARCRMSILYDQAALHKALVLGTGNKTELYLGYFTKYGDGGVDVEPIGNLYKAEVRELAHYLNIPEKIILKTPTADLWEGQTDESEMGLTYNEADEILSLLIDKKYELSQIISQGYSKKSVERVMALIENSHHKRNLPPTC